MARFVHLPRCSLLLSLYTRTLWKPKIPCSSQSVFPKCPSAANLSASRAPGWMLLFWSLHPQEPFCVICQDLLHPKCDQVYFPLTNKRIAPRAGNSKG